MTGGVATEWAQAHRGRRFLLLHGYRNWRPLHHWQWWLAEQLRRRGEQVLYPQFPQPQRPDPADWLDLLTAELAQLGCGERVVVAHSLGCALWLLAATEGVLTAPAGRVLLVAPAGPGELRRERLSGFDLPWRSDVLARSSRTRPTLVASDNDPTCPETPAARLYGAPAGLHTITLSGAGHFTAVDGYGPWPAVLDWCLDPTSSLLGDRSHPRRGSAFPEESEVQDAAPE